MNISAFIERIYDKYTSRGTRARNKNDIFSYNNGYLTKLYCMVEATKGFINMGVPLNYLYGDDITSIETCFANDDSDNLSLFDYYLLAYRGIVYPVHDAVIRTDCITYSASSSRQVFLKLSLSSIVIDVISLLLDIDVCTCDNKLFLKLQNNNCEPIDDNEYDLIKISSAINIATLSTVDYSTWEKIRSLYISIAKDPDLFNALRMFRRLVLSDNVDFDYPILVDTNITNDSLSIESFNINSYTSTSVILSKARELSIELLKEKSVPIRVSLAKKLPDIEGGKSMQSLMHALSDLLNSSVIITKEGDVVKVSVNPEQGSCLISPAENIPNITQLTVIKNGTTVPIVSLNDDDVTALIRSAESDNNILSTIENSINTIHQNGDSIINSIQQAVTNNTHRMTSNSTSNTSRFEVGSRRTINGVTEELTLMGTVPVWRVVSEESMEVPNMGNTDYPEIVDIENTADPIPDIPTNTEDDTDDNTWDEDDDEDNTWDEDDDEDQAINTDDHSTNTRVSIGDVTLVIDSNGVVHVD